MTKQSRNSKNGSRKPNQRTGKKPEERTNCKLSQIEDKLDSKGRDNDPNWYYLDKQIAEQASAFAFDQFIGVPSNVVLQEYDTTAEEGSRLRTQETCGNTPSIMVIEVNPCPGDTSSIQRGINVASLATYSALSSQNAKTTNYAPQDITTLILSLGEVISIMEHIRRAFGIAFTYNQRNRSVPYKLLDAMGFDPDDFLLNIAQHRLDFNSFVTTINKIPFISNIGYLHKCRDMYQNVYLDKDSSMAQLVIMKPYSTWIMDEVYSDQGTGLRTTAVPPAFCDTENTKKGKWEEWKALVGRMLEALLTSTTYNYIYSDILNFVSKTGATKFTMDYLPEGYVVLPAYNKTFSMQMHNLTIVGTPVTTQADGFTHDNDVAPNVNKNIIDYHPRFTNSEQVRRYLITPYLDFDTDTPSLEDKIEATRYQGIVTELDDNTVYAVPVSLPDHYVVRIKYGLNYLDKDKVIQTIVNTLDSSLFGLFDSNARENSFKYIPMSTFDWGPLVFAVPPYTMFGTSLNNQLIPLGELNYFTLLSKEWYSKVNDITFQGLFTLR